MVNVPKKQHYLPAVYLRQFSPNPSQGRRSKVWRFDGRKSATVSVESQCFAKNHYSLREAKQVETMFGEIEGFYAKCVRKIMADEDPTPREFFGLILTMFDLHIRNASYSNLTGKESIEAYRIRVTGLRREILLDREEGSPNDDEVRAHLKAHWRVRILRVSHGNDFLTCDNPSMWFTMDGKRLSFVLLAITPSFYAVAYDKRAAQVKGSYTTAKDEMILNQNALLCSIRSIYTHKELTDEEKRGAATTLAQRSEPPGYVDAQEWCVNLRRFPAGVNLSFIHAKSEYDREPR